MTTDSRGETTLPGGVVLTTARRGDLPVLEALLEACNLPHEGIGENLPGFILARAGGVLVGSVGLEVVGHGVGLLRSLAVAPEWRGRGVGRFLCRVMMARATQLGIHELWLLTATAEPLFARSGFSVASRHEVPPEVQVTDEFARLCPDTATCMWTRLTPAAGRRDLAVASRSSCSATADEQWM